MYYLSRYTTVTRKYEIWSCVGWRNLCRWLNAEFIIKTIQRLSIREDTVWASWTLWKLWLWIARYVRGGVCWQATPHFHNWPWWDAAFSFPPSDQTHRNILFAEKKFHLKLNQSECPGPGKNIICTYNPVYNKSIRVHMSMHLENKVSFCKKQNDFFPNQKEDSFDYKLSPTTAK